MELMKVFIFSSKRNLSSVASSPPICANPSSNQSKLLRLCQSGVLPPAIHLLNSIDTSFDISVQPIVYASLIQTCTKVKSFIHGLQFHAHVVKSGLDFDRWVGNSLLALYFKVGSDFRETRRVFDGLSVKDAISWTSMISGYLHSGKPRSSLQMFLGMMDVGMDVNGFALSATIKACCELRELRFGQCLHADVFRRGFDLSHVISSALIDFYGKNNELDGARRLFDEMLEPDTICWTALISALTRNDLYTEALSFFCLMLKNQVLSPDGHTFGSVLTACANLGRLKQGKQMHAKVLTSGIHGNVVVESSLVDMYGKCGSLAKSQRVFYRMPIKNTVSWSALLGGYCQNKRYESVVKIFREMDEVDLYCFGTVLRACAGLAAVRQGKEVHCQYVRRGGWEDVIVESALVDLYAKCGCIDFACRVFSQMSVRNLVTWNSIISGLAENGRGEEALEMFNWMTRDGMKPDYITFVSVLKACSHKGLLDEGRKLFHLMTKEHGIIPGIEHYNCMVGLLSRAGLLEEAEHLIENADCRNESSLWAVLLGACTGSTESNIAERIAWKMIELEPSCHRSYVLIANVYRSRGRWHDACNIRKLMDDRGVKKTTGMSWVGS